MSESVAASIGVHSTETPATLAARITPKTTVDDLRGLIEFLAARGTFRFPTLKSGLFSAAAFEHAGGEVTGYHNAWVRDTVHIAHALWRTGQPEAAVRAVRALATFFARSRGRFEGVIAGTVDRQDPMQRPHIRFNGDDLVENAEKWSHAQNDALGAFLWLACRMWTEGVWQPTAGERAVFARFPAYFAAIEFWQDEDSGHWEEVRKVAASSIGVATAGLRELRAVIQAHPEAFAGSVPANVAVGMPAVDRESLSELLSRGATALQTILPAECVQSDPVQRRDADAALLFLIEPFGVITGSVADSVLANVREQLEGPIGIRRYRGDSYWCADYKTLLRADERTSDFSDDLSSRDALLKPGTEAQWCVFDPLLAVIYGKRFLQDRSAANLAEHQRHLRRSLLQLTPAESRFGAFRCPESYFCEQGVWVPNDITPLLWTQANLRWALSVAEAVAGVAGSHD